MPQPYPNGELVIVIDCADLDRSARFWAVVLGYEAGRATSGPYHSLTPVSGVGIDVLLMIVASRHDLGRGADWSGTRCATAFYLAKTDYDRGRKRAELA